MPVRSGDIELPVYHEKTLNGNGIGTHFDESNSESKSKKRYSLPIEISIDEFHRNDQTGSKTVEGKLFFLTIFFLFAVLKIARCLYINSCVVKIIFIIKMECSLFCFVMFCVCFYIK